MSAHVRVNTEVSKRLARVLLDMGVPFSVAPCPQIRDARVFTVETSRGPMLAQAAKVLARRTPATSTRH
jgi:hypothetical protein